MKSPEEMSYNELKELGLIHWYKDRNYRIKRDYAIGRAGGLSRGELVKQLCEKYCITLGYAYTIIGRREINPKQISPAIPRKCEQCGTKLDKVKRRFCEPCAKERIRESQRRHKVKSLKKDKQTNFIIQ